METMVVGRRCFRIACAAKLGRIARSDLNIQARPIPAQERIQGNSIETREKAITPERASFGGWVRVERNRPEFRNEGKQILQGFLIDNSIAVNDLV